VSDEKRSERKSALEHKLALLIDDDPNTRRVLRPLLARRGLDIVQASTGVAGLELLQRFAGSFQLAVVSCDAPGLPAAVIMETIRRFRPEVRVICLTTAERIAASAAERPCLSKPFGAPELETYVDIALSANSGTGGWTSAVSDAAALRAQARFASSGDLVETALELARGMRGEMLEEW
jgi:DNA-binding response OmpR family regulator